MRSTIQFSNLYPHDSEVWHGRVVYGHAGVRGVLKTREDFRGGGGGAVVQHLTQRVNIDVFGCQSGPHSVV